MHVCVRMCVCWCESICVWKPVLWTCSPAGVVFIRAKPRIRLVLLRVQLRKLTDAKRVLTCLRVAEPRRRGSACCNNFVCGSKRSCLHGGRVGSQNHHLRSWIFCLFVSFLLFVGYFFLLFFSLRSCLNPIAWSFRD